MTYSILIVVLTFIVMEFVAFALHKYVMHGFLWSWHKDHHQPKYEKLEKNDRFFLVFAIPSWLGIMFGLMYNINWFFSVGLGIALYGICYVIVHEIIIHQRLPFFKRLNSKYIKGIRFAHKIHHKNQGKFHGVCFGMLIVPLKYFK